MWSADMPLFRHDRRIAALKHGQPFVLRSLYLFWHTVSKTGLHYVNISQNELLRGYAIRGGTHEEHAKRKAPRVRG